MKVDIIIKSFNRVFYLDKTLYSIKKFVTGYNNIVIVDDGTPDMYLSKILEKYSNIEIKKSKFHQEKSSKIVNHQEIDGYKIPSDLWLDTVKNATNYVLMIEDDVWFTDYVDLSEISEEMASNNVHLSKIGWQSNEKFLYNFKEEQISNNLVSQSSKKIFTSNRKVMQYLLHNKYKSFSLLCRLGLANNQTINEYYNLLSILMGLYRKDYWLYTWQDSRGRVNERDLLKNSVAWYNKHKNNKCTITRTIKEKLKTTYISSATNSYHKYAVNFDVLHFNSILNKKWLDNEFDILNNFPDDYSRSYLSSFIKNKEVYYEWSNIFLKSFGKDPELY